MKRNADGSESPYELNITWFSALNRAGSGEAIDLQIDRFIASRAVALALRGVPGIYLPSLIGHRNDTEAVFKDGSLRSINRSAIEEPSLRELLANPRGIPARIARAYGDLLEIRVAEPAFHPTAAQRVLDLDRRIFTLLRMPGCGSGQVLSLINLSADEVAVELSSSEIEGRASGLVDLVAGDTFGPVSEQFFVALAPYQVRWLKATETARGRRAAG
jgi:sucrose phosphorylase